MVNILPFQTHFSENEKQNLTKIIFLEKKARNHAQGLRQTGLPQLIPMNHIYTHVQ